MDYPQLTALVARLTEAIDNNPHPVSGEDESKDLLASVRAAAHRIEGLPERVPWEWVTTQWLDGLERTLTAVITPMESYVGQPVAEDGAPTPELPITWDEATHLWDALGRFLPAMPGKAEEDLAREVVVFRGAAREALDSVDSRVVQLREAIDEGTANLRERVDESDEALTALAARHTELDATISARQTELETTITEQTARLDAAIRENQSQFSTAQETHRQAVTALVQESRDQLTTTLADLEAKATRAAEEAEAASRAHVEALAELEAQARKSWDAVSTGSVAGFFQNEANDQADSADRWRLIGVALLVAVAVAVFLELTLGDSTPSLEHTAGRLPFAIVAAGVGAYALRESRHHREQAVRLRQREVDVSTIAPYLANMADTAAAEQLKLKHAAKLFIDDPDGVAPTVVDDAGTA